MIVCAACGEENAERARFCQACGAALEPAAPAAEERRVVSILFIDLVGFTARSERLDPEDVRAVLTRYHDRARTEVERYGGVVEKFVGDAVMGVFGAPVTYGDDPERAVRAALAVRDALEEMNTDDPALDLRARFAVNTGEAIVALAARPNLGEAMVAGDVVNTAARLQSAAPVDGVLVGEETYAATRSAIGYEPAEPVVAKGKSEPIKAWLATAPLAEVGERTFSRVPMVGRGRELATLRELWERVVEERKPHLVTVFGPTGIGKSRLAHELSERVEASGGRMLFGRSVGYAGAGPYSSFAQHVKQVAGIFDNDEMDAAKGKLLSALRELSAGDDVEEAAANLAVLLGLRTDGGTAPDRESLFFSARLLVEGLGERQPTMLVFEDIHWADPSLLDLIESLVARARDVPVLFLTIARPELLASRPSWAGGLPAYSGLPLAPLTDAEAADLTSRLLDLHGLEEMSDRAGALATQAEGNPLFLEELAASLAERPTVGAEELPTSIRGIIGARLDALPRAEREVLLDASVAGKVFWRNALLQIRPDRVDLSALLGSLEQRDLIRRESVSRIHGEQQFTFKHTLIREVAYLTLPRSEKRVRHEAVARFLEDATPDAGEYAAVLAYHWREAGDGDRAYGYLMAAAEQAGRGWAKDRALQLYQEALELVPEDDAERRREVIRRRAVMAAAAAHMVDAELQLRVRPSEER